MKRLKYAAAAVALAAAAGTPVHAEDSADNDKARLGNWGIETANTSDTVKPGDDFFTWVNQGWLDSSELPPGFSRWGSFTELSIEAEDRVDAIIHELDRANAEPRAPAHQRASLYDSYMDTETPEELRLIPKI